MTRVSKEDKLNLIKRAFTTHKVDSKCENVQVWCPYCKNENKNKLKLFIHIEKGFYHCWVCESKGSNLTKLIGKVNPNLLQESKTIFKVKEKQKFDLGIDLSVLDYDYQEKSKEEEVQVLNEFPKHFELLANSFNSYDPDIKAVFKYALSRGFNKHKLYHLRVGYSLDNEFKRYMIIPSIDAEGNLNFFTSRKIDALSSDGYKYKNSKVQKKNIIFNEVNIDFTKQLVIVEGPLDLIKTPDNSTCLLGSSLTEDMKLFQEIVKNKTPVVLALDSDAYWKTVKIAEKLVDYDVSVKIADTRCADDVGDMDRDTVLRIIDNAKEFNIEQILNNKIKRL